MTSSPFAGAEMMTFLAPPSRWPLALSASVKRPVDSTTRSMPSSPHLMADGSFSEKTLIVRSLTLMAPSTAAMSASNRP